MVAKRELGGIMGLSVNPRPKVQDIAKLSIWPSSFNKKVILV
jgi:hypothetical protein